MNTKPIYEKASALPAGQRHFPLFAAAFGVLIALILPMPSTASILQGDVASEALPPVPRLGQSVTILPDDSWLLLGGGDRGGSAQRATIINGKTGARSELQTAMRYARTGHTATLLPDGSILILGGADASGKLVPEAERFVPARKQFEQLPATGLTPRAWHFASLLSDGRVLIAGGVNGQGIEERSVELWNPATGLKERMPNDATASKPHLDNRPSVVATFPANGASNVDTHARPVVRFSKPLRMSTLNPDTVTLIGPGGAVPIKIVPADRGTFSFITPNIPLQPGSRYSLFIDGVTDESGSPLPFTGIDFETASRPSFSNAGAGIGAPNTLHDVSAIDQIWIPGTEHFSGNWRSGGAASALQSIPAYQAPSGVTALAGRILLLNGNPLANATLAIGRKTTQTDATGRFLLDEVASGQQVLLIDGSSANAAEKTYGVFETKVELAPEKTTVLPYTIWMPLLDTAHTLSIASPTGNETVATTPMIPGLELHIPAGTVIRDRNGQIVTEIGITAIPIDQPPFPLPSSSVPVYFTVQPGGAYLQGVNREAGRGARLIYPNFSREPAGTKVDFWNYDPREKGWYVYGQGTVSADARQVVPDPGVALYEFSGAMFNGSGLTPPAVGPPPNNRPPPGRSAPGNGKPGSGAAGGGGGPGDSRPPCGAGGGGCEGNPISDGEPVDLATGLFVYEKTDLVLDDVIPLSITRTYRPNDTSIRPFGIGANFPYGIFIWSANQYQEADLILPDGGRVHYVRTSPGTGWTDAVFKSTATPTPFYGSQITWNGDGWDLTLKDGSVYVFGENAPLQAIRDRYGNTVTITRSSGGQTGNITRITSPNGRWISFTYDASNRITQAQDHLGRIVSYTYDASGRLWKVTDPVGGLTTYTYDASHRMLTITDPRGITYLTNAYDASGRVSLQTLADNGTYQFAYTVSNGKVTQADVTDPRGNVRRATFNSDGYPLTETRALGASEQQSFTYNRQAGSNLLLSVTDPLNRVTAYTYDTAGNRTSVTNLSGTANAVTTSFTYEPIFNQVASVTDPLNHTSSYVYDGKGNLITATDPLNRTANFSYNAAGQLTAATDPLNHTTQYGYDQGYLATVTDALGNISKRFTDIAGRPIALTDPLGNVVRIAYDAVDRISQIIDPLGGTIAFVYDANGNLSSVTDPRGGVTGYSYNNKDRIATRTDPLLATESFTYDLADNLASFTDRKGQLTLFTYDPLNRRTFAGFGATVSGGGTSYLSSVTYTYDGGNRLMQAVDSQSGTIARSFDDLNRLTSEVTPQGQIGYTYDAAGRRTSLAVAGQTSVSYTWDNADQLTSISQGSTNAGYTYDAAGRRSTVTLPNGVLVSYTFDSANHLTGLSYQNGDTTIGNFVYTYDSAGRRRVVGGSLAQTNLPNAIASTTHNAANQTTQWGGSSLSYDANGNLTAQGSSAYVWDERNRLVSITSGGSSIAAFHYDPFGRRTVKNVSGTSTGFLYDGLNVQQELAGSTPSANLLVGLGIDETLVRTDAAGVRNFLTDAIGSTIALTDNGGAVQTSYVYEPYGKATESGQTNSNSFQYTGRENDGTGLFYYRARYYSPTLQSFISEDPIGVAGGINLYGYVEGNPLNYVDPLGLQVWSQGQLPARVQQHNQLNDPMGQLSREFGPSVFPDPSTPIVGLPNNQPWCRTVCPDEGNQCRPVSKNSIPLFSKPGCYNVCEEGPFVDSGALAHAADGRKPRQASAGEVRRLIGIIRGGL